MKKVLLVIVLGLFYVQSAFAAERYYMVVFGAQDWLNTFKNSHTYATFVKATGEGEDYKNYKVEETRTISWMPKTGAVILLTDPEIGSNWTLEYSLNDAVERKTKVGKWGPYEIKKELYERAKKQVIFVESGQILYHAVDKWSRPEGRAFNCEHAVSDLDVDNGLLVKFLKS